MNYTGKQSYNIISLFQQLNNIYIYIIHTNRKNMNCKIIFHLTLLLTLPFIIYGNQNETPEILVLTTESDGITGDYASAMKTFKKYEVIFKILNL